MSEGGPAVMQQPSQPRLSMAADIGDGSGIRFDVSGPAVGADAPVVIEQAQGMEEEVRLEPEPKRFKSSSGAVGGASSSNMLENEYKLEERLNGILCCAVCLDLPNLMIYQCTNGHLMCASCLFHLLADARLKDEGATCPSCRCEITRAVCVRNLAVEKAISELPCVCQFCAGQLPRHKLIHHEAEVCAERLVRCTYAPLGCNWLGAHRTLGGHEAECPFPNKLGVELMESIGQINQRKESELRLYQNMLDFLSYEKVQITEVQLRPYRTDDFLPKLFYETVRFPAFTHQWVVKARVNDHVDNPLHAARRSLSYQLILKGKPAAPSRILYVALKGPFGDARIDPVTYEFEFSGDALESTFRDLPVSNSASVNHLVSAKTINFRLILIQLPK